MHSQMKKIGRVREAAKQAGVEIAIQVDGGVNRETIQIAAEAGADVFVAGSTVFRAEDAYEEVEQLRRIASEAMHGH